MNPINEEHSVPLEKQVVKIFIIGGKFMVYFDICVNFDI